MARTFTIRLPSIDSKGIVIAPSEERNCTYMLIHVLELFLSFGTAVAGREG